MTATALLLLVPLVAPAHPAPAGPPPAAAEAADQRALAAWVDDLRSTDFDKKRDAAAALIKAGPKAKALVPQFVKMIGEENPDFNVVAILGAIGPGAKEAVPALIALLPKQNNSGYGVEPIAVAIARIDGPALEATRALLLASGKCDPISLLGSQTLADYPAQVVPHVVQLCADEDVKVRVKAATVLSHLKTKPNDAAKSIYERAGAGAKGVYPALEQMLGDDDTDVRLTAARAIAVVAPELAEKTIPVVVALALDDKRAEKITPQLAYAIFHPVPAPAAKALVPLLDTTSDRARNWAIVTLSMLPVREPIEEALKDGPTARVRHGAASVLGTRNGEAVKSAPALRAALADPEVSVRFAAAWALVRVNGARETTAAAIPVLIAGLDLESEAARIEAITSLVMVGSLAKPAVPALKKLFGDPKSEVRLEAAIALADIDPKEAANAVPLLAAELKAASDATAIRIAKVLAGFGPVAKPAVPELVKKFDAKNPHLRVYSAEAVGRIDPAQVSKAVAVLMEILKNEKYHSSMVRHYALNALRRIGPAAKEAGPALAKVLRDAGDFHGDVALAMIALEPNGAEPAFEWVRKALADEPTDDTYEIIDLLPELGAAGKPLVPELMGKLKSKARYHQQQAILTLAAIGPGAKDALPELKKLAESASLPDIKEHAAEAIKKIEAR